MINFVFNKPLYKTEELLELIPIPASTWAKFQSEWIKQGGATQEMGRVKIKGCSKSLWNGPKVLEWLEKNKIEDPDINVLVINNNKQETRS
jgi:hypothetical protein|tara:strand:+ start:66 stop:338 length:273 start_codon:yes stop_codon:yes gene_type:complete